MEVNQEKKWCVYKHTNKINGKVYIGQTCQNPEDRWQNGEGYKTCPRFYNAIQKYGWDNFVHEILYKNLTLDEANKKEIDLIKEFQSTNDKFGYNIQDGGKNSKMSEETKAKITARRRSYKGINNPNYGKHLSQETKDKIRKKNLGRHLSEESRKKMSESHKRNGKSDYWRGKKFSEEHKKKIGIASKRENLLEATLQKMSIAHKGENNYWYGKKRPKETCNKISKANSGENHPNWGKHLPGKTRKKISENQMIPVLCVETQIIYKSIKEAGETLNIDNSSIVKCCKGKLKSAGGYHWEYSTQEEYQAYLDSKSN